MTSLYCISLSFETKVLHVYNRNPKTGTRVSVGFKLNCHSKAVSFSTKGVGHGRKLRYGVSLPSILHSLDTEDEIDIAMSSWVGKLTPKEKTIILKKQKDWVKVLRVFRWMKTQEDYIPNVIHYNIVLRVLGRAQKWDELRLCWIEMEKDGVFPTNNTYGMLVDVYAKAGLVKEALLWLKHMKQRNLFPDEVTMNTIVRVLKDVGEFEKGHRFFENWCVGKVELEGLDLDSVYDFELGLDPFSPKHLLSTELFKSGGRMPPSKVSNPMDAERSVRKPLLTATYNTLIDLHGKAGRFKDASNAFAEMLKSGVAPDTVTFNTMIYTCGSHGLLSEAEFLLTRMEEKGVSPDTRTYNIFIALYADQGNIDAALMCYRKIKEVGLRPDTVSHRTVLRILCERNMVTEVESVIKEMKNSGVRINEHSLPVTIKMYISVGLLAQAMALFEHCHLEGRISSKTYAAIIDVYAEKGLSAEAEAVFFRKMDSVIHKKDVVEYNVMIKAYGKAKLYDKALSLFKSMRSNGTWPDECTYNSLVQMLSNGGFIDLARDVLAEMQEAGFKPHCSTFSAVINGYIRLGQASNAADVFKDMTRAGVKPNEVVYGSLIDGFAEAGMVEEALHCFHSMQDSGIYENQIILTSLIKAYSKVGCLEEAQKLYAKMMSTGDGPDVFASNSMITLYADHGLVEEAKLIFDKLKEIGQADGVSYANMMHLYRNIGMIDKAIDISQEMQETDLLRDTASFNAILTSYVTNAQLRECGDLLQQMLMRKIPPDGGTFKLALTVIKKSGVPTEIVTQLESAYRDGKPYAREALMTYVFSILGLHAFAVECCKGFMKKPNIRFESYVYNVAICAYGSYGKVDEALTIFMRMQDEGVEPDVVTYLHLVRCYGKAGMVEGIKRVYSKLMYEEIEPNEALYMAVIDAYKDVKRNDLAELVSQEMKFAIGTEEDQDPSDSEYEEDFSEPFEPSDDMVS